MIAPLFYRWERHLYARSDNRVVRPFEWGLDWLGAHATGGAGPRPAEEHVLADWSRRMVTSSDSFFANPPTDEFEWRADLTVADGSTGTVVFPSAVVTPDAANNTVYARFFPARRRRRRTDRGPVVLVLPQWNAGPGEHVGLCRLLAHVGISSLRLTLPYHDARMPPSLTRADFIVSANVGRTLQVCRQAVVDARRAIAWLAREGYERIGILGTSLGSCLSMLTAAHEPLIRAQALNHISRYFADVVWEGLSTQHVRRGLDGHITLDRLRGLWMPISPQAYVDRVRDKKTLLVYARYDTTFPVPLSRALIDEMDRLGVPYRLAVLPCGHYTTGLSPFKYLDGYHLVSFLRRSL